MWFCCYWFTAHVAITKGECLHTTSRRATQPTQQLCTDFCLPLAERCFSVHSSRRPAVRPSSGASDPSKYLISSSFRWFLWSTKNWTWRNDKWNWNFFMPHQGKLHIHIYVYMLLFLLLYVVIECILLYASKQTNSALIAKIFLCLLSICRYWQCCWFCSSNCCCLCQVAVISRSLLLCHCGRLWRKGAYTTWPSRLERWKISTALTTKAQRGQVVFLSSDYWNSAEFSCFKFFVSFGFLWIFFYFLAS